MEMPRMRAWARGLRTKATSFIPGSRISATNWPRPRKRRTSSFLTTRAPMPWLDGRASLIAETWPVIARSRALLFGDRQPLGKLTSGRTRGVDAHFGHREMFRVRGRVENGALRSRDEHNVLLRAHARGERPHDVVDVEDIDVIVHDDDVFRVLLGAERGHNRHLRLAFGDLLHRNEGHERAARGMRHVHGAHVGEVAAQRVENFAFPRDARNQDMIPGHS